MYDLFGKIASTESDCSSAQKGGDLGIAIICCFYCILLNLLKPHCFGTGKFGRGQMQKSFEVSSYS